MTEREYGADKRYELLISKDGLSCLRSYTNDLAMIQDIAIKATLDGYDAEIIDRAPDHPAGTKL
jgi:hypothetical protein